MATIVVKVGGATGNVLDPVLDDLVGRTGTVLVHGGSEAIDRLGTALGRPAEFYTTPSGVVSRRCDAAQLATVVLALSGEVQTGLTASLLRRGVRAVGLSGVDGGLLKARRRTNVRAIREGKVVRLADDLSGTVEAVDGAFLGSLVDLGFLPVVGPPAVTAEGEVVNVDADSVAAHVAGALRAETLVLLTNVPGLLRDVADPSSVIPRVERSGLEEAISRAGGRMKKKLHAAGEALDAGVARVVIAPSGGDRPVDTALAGQGTVIS